MDNTIRALAKRPGEDYKVINISNTLEALQEYVGGYIETVTLYADVIVICNEEGRLDGLPYNDEIAGINFVGPILVVGCDGEDFTDLSEDAILDWDDIRMEG